MKYATFLLLVMAFVVQAMAQTSVMSISQAEEKGIYMKELDERYPGAIHADPEAGVFDGESKFLFVDQYRQLIQGLANHLNEYGFYWREPTRMFTRIYFSETGSVNYFFYNASHAGFNKNKEIYFNRIVREFLSDYKLDIRADTGFSQCSPVTYMNALSSNE